MLMKKFGLSFQVIGIFLACQIGAIAIAEEPHLEAVKNAMRGLAFVRKADTSEAGIKVSFEKDAGRALEKLASMPKEARESIAELTFMSPLEDHSKYQLVEKLTKLSYLNLAKGKWGPALSKAVAKLPLKYLWVESTGVTGDDLQWIAECKSLQILMLGRNLMKGKDVHCLKNLENLTQLALNGIPMESKDCEFLKAMPELVVLHLSDTNVGDDIAAHLVNCQRLKILALSNTKVTDQGAEKIQEQRRVIILTYGQDEEKAIVEPSNEQPK